MANEQAAEEQQGSGWLRTVANALMIYFAINTVTSLIGGKFGGQNTNPDGTVKPAAGPAQTPALWPLGTKMVR
jgi:hypothetical protein